MDPRLVSNFTIITESSNMTGFMTDIGTEATISQTEEDSDRCITSMMEEPLLQRPVSAMTRALQIESTTECVERISSRCGLAYHEYISAIGTALVADPENQRVQFLMTAFQLSNVLMHMVTRCHLFVVDPAATDYMADEPVVKGFNRLMSLYQQLFPMHIRARSQTESSFSSFKFAPGFGYELIQALELLDRIKRDTTFVDVSVDTLTDDQLTLVSDSALALESALYTVFGWISANSTPTKFVTQEMISSFRNYRN